MQLATTEEYKRYFQDLEKGLQALYNIAREARAKALDPSLEPEPHVVKDFAEMVEGLVGPHGVADKIRDLNKKMSREKIAFKIAEEIVHAGFGHLDEQQAAEQAVRTSLAILTGGITVAPIQGISAVKIKQNLDRSRYLAIYFAGPIRSAGGTEQALTLVIGDFIRRRLGLDRYKPTHDDVRRFVEEVRVYEREVSRFQYHVSDEELEKTINNIPVEVTGVGTDPVEVSSFRNLPRIETNSVRGGALRVVNDGVIGRSQKVWKTVEELGMEGWGWLRDVRKVKEEKTGKKEFLYMEDVIAGRPIFSFPSRKGGFRLRYGRARNTGLAALGVHPATMSILKDFLAIGTQMRIEGPGKAGIVLPVDTIEPPVVKLKDGSIVKVGSLSVAKKIKTQVEKILFLGDLLVGFGEFLENNMPLVTPGYCDEWWVQDLSSAISEKFGGSVEAAAEEAKLPFTRLKQFLERPFESKPTAQESLVISKKFGVPLQPHFTYFWENISSRELLELRKALLRSERDVKHGVIKRIEIPMSVRVKSTLEAICLPHKLSDGKIIVEEAALILAECLQINKPNLRVKPSGSTTELIERLSGIRVREKGGTYIGARMGRPEKAKRRKMHPPVHVLFPVGLAGGSQRDILKAVERGVIQVEIARRKCPACGIITFKTFCPKCDVKTTPEKVCPRCERIIEKETCSVCGTSAVNYERQEINIKEIYDAACKKVGVRYIRLVKGVKGLISSMKTPEPIEKGILRAKHQLYVFKDGTVRFDATNAPLTHFKPSETGVSVERLRQLGYVNDLKGRPLKERDQICELKVQDVIIPESGAEYLVKVTQFIDDLLERIYALPPFYRVKGKADLIGHLVIGLAPHTAAGVVGRIIGFTKASVCFAHPLWHNIKRRDCDGDEDSIILVLDVLLNFSKSYIPARIGGMMDAPLLIISTVNPLDVDEAHNIDVSGFYPIAFYESSMRRAKLEDVDQLVDIIAHRLGTPAQFQGYSFTHDTADISMGNLRSIYVELGSMKDKVRAQLLLAEKIGAVDVKEEVERVLTTHLIRDIIGNLRAFTGQKFRCKKCSTNYRRMLLSGKCPNCGGEITFTVHRGGIEKYMELSNQLIKKYGVRDYFQQRINLIQDELDLLFERKAKQVKLMEYI